MRTPAHYDNYQLGSPNPVTIHVIDGIEKAEGGPFVALRRYDDRVYAHEARTTLPKDQFPPGTGRPPYVLGNQMNKEQTIKFAAKRWPGESLIISP